MEPTGPLLISHPWLSEAHSQLAEDPGTDGMLTTTLGTSRGCVWALFSVSRLLILVEVTGTELHLKCPMNKQWMDCEDFSVRAEVRPFRDFLLLLLIVG